MHIHGDNTGVFQFCGLKPTINGRFIAFPVGYWGRKRGPADVLIGVREGFTWILFLSPFLSQPRQSLNDGHSDRVQALSERRVVLAAFFLSLAGARVGVWLSFPALKVS